MFVLRTAVLFILLAAIVGSLGFVKYTQISDAIAAGEAYPEHSESVEAITTELSSFSRKIRLPGEVVLRDHVVLHSQHAGQIARLGFQPGDVVESGQLLVQLDIGMENAQLIGARAEVALARLGLERAEKLLESGSANQARLDQARATYDIARSNVEVIEQTIEQKTIRAPFSGQTRPGQLTVGQYLTSGSEVARITDQHEIIWIDFRLPQFLGDPPVGAAIGVIARSNENWTGPIISRDAGVSSDTRTRLYRVELRGLEAALSHGSFVEVEVALDAPIPVVELPSSALQSDAYGQFVNLLVPGEQEGTFRANRRDVTGVQYYGERVLISGGLEAGLLVATDGAFKLYPGVLTNVVEDLPQDPQSDSGW
ncbi:efflux RND transporter periplasmic adaptor subunit [Ruegeria arenilitoris]|uniref:efflux RND transporter periplasmic adaptor subunit n=1 Tax=Ruegeria arenilitoris TaxID=1173585 RepID=UPI0014819299|nr:efflux RND transporter periplasmic adaptor subunit [Ruegeria arenilitoris]